MVGDRVVRLPVTRSWVRAASKSLRASRCASSSINPTGRKPTPRRPATRWSNSRCKPPRENRPPRQCPQTGLLETVVASRPGRPAAGLRPVPGVVSPTDFRHGNKGLFGLLQFVVADDGKLYYRTFTNRKVPSPGNGRLGHCRQRLPAVLATHGLASFASWSSAIGNSRGPLLRRQCHAGQGDARRDDDVQGGHPRRITRRQEQARVLAAAAAIAVGDLRETARSPSATATSRRNWAFEIKLERAEQTVDPAPARRRATAASSNCRPGQEDQRPAIPHHHERAAGPSRLQVYQSNYLEMTRWTTVAARRSACGVHRRLRPGLKVKVPRLDLPGRRDLHDVLHGGRFLQGEGKADAGRADDRPTAESCTQGFSTLAIKARPSGATRRVRAWLFLAYTPLSPPGEGSGVRESPAGAANPPSPPTPLPRGEGRT